MRIIVGSMALDQYFNIGRKPTDIDIWTDEINPKKLPKCDFSTIPIEILQLVDHNSGIATPESVLAIKMSHLGWDIKWKKHKSDVLFLKDAGVEPKWDLYYALVEYWKKEHGNKSYLSLYQTKSDFFNDHVDYVYDHDFLHELVAKTEPIYKKCLKDGEEVMICEEKFKKMDFYEQIRMFREEISVIAIERWLIPERSRYKIDWVRAYSLALHKTICDLTKNWATMFLIENIEHFYKPDYSYFERFFNELKEGKEIMAKKLSKEEKDQVWQEIFDAIVQETRHQKYFEYDGYETPPDSFKLDLAEGDVALIDGLQYFDQDGGGEGGAEHCYCIFGWKGVAYQVNYSYYSFSGYEMYDDSLYIVEPVEKTITVWE